MATDTPTPLPRAADGDEQAHTCHDPITLSWARSARKLSAALLLMAIGSLGGGAVWLATIAAEAAELRADVRHISERQTEIRAQIREQSAAVVALERKAGEGSERVAAELAGLRAEVRALAAQVERLERPRGRQ